MTDTDHDGWPDKYSDPRNRPHPDVLRLTVEPFDEMREDTLAATEALTESEEQPAVVSFRTVGKLRKIITDRRLELLQALMNADGAAESISALAKALDRDYRTVHDDVTILNDYGLVFIKHTDITNPQGSVTDAMADTIAEETASFLGV